MSLVPSDEELFEDRPKTPQAVIEHGSAILRLLLASGFQPPYGFDMDDAEKVWGSHLWGFDLGVMARAIHQYDLEAGEQRELPTEGELETFTRAWVQAAQNAERNGGQRVDSDDACSICDDNGWASPDGDGYSPCPRCRPEAAELWAKGHGNAAHRRRGGCSTCQSVFGWQKVKGGTHSGPRRARPRASASA